MPLKKTRILVFTLFFFLFCFLAMSKERGLALLHTPLHDVVLGPRPKAIRAADYGLKLSKL
jgi:hypothetical protein